MADDKQPENPTGPESSPESAPAQAEEAESYLDQVAQEQADFTNENIDEFLEKQDPEFAGKLNDMKKDTELTLTESEVDDDTAALHDEIELWRSGSGLRRKLYMALPFLPRLSLSIKKLFFRVRSFSHATKVRLRHFIVFLGTTGRRNVQSAISRFLQVIKDGLVRRISDFKSLSLKLKLAFVSLLILFAGSSAALFLTWKGQLVLFKEPELFVTDLAKYADSVIEIETGENFEKFYDNVRSAPNLLLIEKIVVNIRPSKSSGSNPMAAVDFYVEGLNPDVVIEVKDREAFFRDLIQRTIEDFSFDQLSSVDGKQLMIQSLLREMNRQLTTGELRNIRLRTVIVKP